MKVQKEITLTKKEVKLFNDIHVCSTACRKIIEQVVKHFESNEITLQELWAGLAVKHKINIEDEVWEVKKDKLLFVEDREIYEMLSSFKHKEATMKYIKEQIKEALK